MKKCSRCGQLKSLTEFHKETKSKDGLKSDCKICRCTLTKLWIQNNKEEIKAKRKLYYKKNRDIIIAKVRNWYLENRENVLQRTKLWANGRKDISKKYRKSHREELIKAKKLWDMKNREHRNEYSREYKKRRMVDPNYKIAYYLRTRINKIIKRAQRNGSAIRDLGCSVDELRKHLESKFIDDMSWNNYGYRGWHIDHIIPLCKFDLTDREQFQKACHYTNLQPLWAEENMHKGTK